MKIFFLILFVSFNAFSKTCSPMNHCEVKKIKWGKKGWETVYSKVLEFKEFCESDRPGLQLEPELGIELWHFSDEITVSLYTYKLTYIVAGAKAPAGSKFMNFQHRLEPKGSSIVEVTCSQK